MIKFFKKSFFSFVSKRNYVSGNYRKSIECSKKLLSIDSSNIGNIILLCECYMHLNKKEDAEMYAKKALAVDDINYDALSNLVNIYYSQNHFDIAINYVEILLENKDKYRKVSPLEFEETDSSIMNKVYSDISNSYTQEENKRVEFLSWCENFKDWYDNSMQDRPPSPISIH